MTTLWTFLNKEKLEQFAKVLAEAGIAYQTGNLKNPDSEVTLSVDEADYAEARKILMKYRKRKTAAGKL